MTIENNIFLVTGASSGIGEALVRKLIKEHQKVVGLSRSKEKLEILQQDLGPSFIPFVCDVSQREDLYKTCHKILQQGLCPQVFFLNAGLAGEGALDNPEKFSLLHHDTMMAVNYFGVLGFVEYFEKPCLQQRGGHFIVTGSVNGIFAPPLGSAYSASKAAISKAFDSLSLTYYGTNLKFSSIYAGPVKTKGLKGQWPFTWEPDKIANYMYTFSKSKKTRGYPSIFYLILSYLLNILPSKVTIKLLKYKI